MKVASCRRQVGKYTLLVRSDSFDTRQLGMVFDVRRIMPARARPQSKDNVIEHHRQTLHKLRGYFVFGRASVRPRVRWECSKGAAELLMDDNATAEAPRPGTSLNRPMTKGGPDQSMRPMTRCGSVLCFRACARVSMPHKSEGDCKIV